MAKLTKKQRQDIEALILEVFYTIDKSNTNTDHYKKLFAKMTDDQFYKFISAKFPYRFHEKPFVTEPSMHECRVALEKIGKEPLYCKVNLPYLYTNKDGVPVNTRETLVVWIPLKKVKQFLTKKNSMSIDISTRDMKTGLLTGVDKNGKTSDREMESLAVAGLDATINEFSKYRADSMNAKNELYNLININGTVTQKEVPVGIDDSLSKNLLNTYLIGSGFNSNLINQGYYLPYTIKNKQKKIERK